MCVSMFTRFRSSSSTFIYIQKLLEPKFFFKCYGDHRYLHVLTHSFPTRRSSDLFPLASRTRPDVGCTPVRCRTPGPLRSMPSRSEEHTSELQSLRRISYAVFC